MSFTMAVREDLARVPWRDEKTRRAELSAALRLGGSLRLSGGGGLGWVGTFAEGVVVRRVRASLTETAGAQSEITVHQPTGLRARTSYRLVLADAEGRVLRALGILDGDGRPVDGVAEPLLRRTCDRVAYLRGALMVAGSVSHPHREAHLELRTAGRATAVGLARLLDRLDMPGRAAERSDGWRVVVKSGSAIGELLTRTGAHSAFLMWDQGRLRRELRAEANRVANADRANVTRAVQASARQVAAVERALASLDFDDLDPKVRETALTRLANPEASLTEIGELLDRPVHKVTVHRRLKELLALAGETEAD